jgi:hypothetical protein
MCSNIVRDPNNPLLVNIVACTCVEERSNISTVAPQVVEGDEKETQCLGVFNVTVVLSINFKLISSFWVLREILTYLLTELSPS